jgi:hypothetical protein
VKQGHIVCLRSQGSDGGIVVENARVELCMVHVLGARRQMSRDRCGR